MPVLFGGALLLVAVGAAYAANRVSVPLLVAFLGLGMLLGSDGPGGIDFDNAELARTVGVLGLALILFEGGLTTDWRELRTVALPAVALSTAGVLVTAAVTGLAAYALFDLRPAAALLVGAIAGSTDAAAVFATLRATRLRRRIVALLEAESGLNDPMAVALTLGLISWITHPDYRIPELALLLVRQLVPGALLGVLFGVVTVWLFDRLPVHMAAFAPVTALGCAAVAFGATQAVGASGFLAVYVVGLALHGTQSPMRRSVVTFHEGTAFLAQIVLFVVLGLLVFPSRLGHVILPGLAIAAVLALVARPLAVLVCTWGFERREQLLVGWAGLRGAVPIVLATFPLSEGIAHSQTMFDAVFFVVVVSVVVQGATLPTLAHRLGLAGEAPAVAQPPMEVGVVRSLGGDIFEYDVEEGDAVAGQRVRDLELPRRALVTMIVRAEQAIPPRGSTRVLAGDRLYLLARADAREEAVRALERWRGAGEAGAGPP